MVGGHRGGGMWYGVRLIALTGTCGRVWGVVAGGWLMWQGWRYVRRYRAIWHGMGWGHVGGCGGMWQVVVICSRVSAHVVGCGGCWKVLGFVAIAYVCSMG